MTEALPGAVFVIDGLGRVKFVTQPAAELVGRTTDELVGMSVLDFVSEESAWAYAAAVAMATDYADVITGPLRVTFTTGGASPETRRADVWATNRLDDPVIGGIVCLVTAETTAVWLGEAVEATSNGAPLTTIAGHVVTAMRGHPVVADAVLLAPVGDRLSAVVPSPLDPRLHEGLGPWQASLSSGVRQHVSVNDLPPVVQAAAREHGYEALWIEPVWRRGAAQPTAVMLLWKTRAGVPSPNQLSSLYQAASILGLCWPEP